ncbi:MAG: tRNA lysidine(34) synthetase TilS [Pseudomonadota bacterium]
MPYYHLSQILQKHRINRFALAVSGGADSMAMTKLVTQYQKEHKSTVHALIVDHGLRSESAAEALHVGELCRQLNMPHTVLSWQHPPITSRLQERARLARYQLLSDWCKTHNYQYLLLAHHANDVLETFMMRLSKGSSLKGLCGLKPMRNMYGITLVRPFLSLPRNTLHTALEGQEYVQDPSNDNTQFERVRLRQWLSQMDIMDGFLKSYHKLEQVDDMIMNLAQTFAAHHIHGQDMDLQPLLDLDLCVFCYVMKLFALDPKDAWRVDDDSLMRLHHSLSKQQVMTLGHKKFTVLDKRILRIEHAV